MGCDIHLFVELDRSEGEGHPRWCLEMGEHATYHDRNYNLFSVLANVRNYWEPKQVPIAAPRDLPDDASVGVKEAAEHWSSDGHSHSWLLLSEVLEWTQWPANCEGFLKWARSLVNKDAVGTLRYYDPSEIRLVFWFDN